MRSVNTVTALLFAVFFTGAANSVTYDQASALLHSKSLSANLTRSFSASVILGLFGDKGDLKYSHLTNDVFNGILSGKSKLEIESETGASSAAIEIITRYISIYSISIDRPLPKITFAQASSFSRHPAIVIPLLSTIGTESVDRYISNRISESNDKGLALSLMRFGHFFGSSVTSGLMTDFSREAVSAEEENEVFINEALLAFTVGDYERADKSIQKIYLPNFRWEATLAALRLHVISGNEHIASEIVRTIPISKLKLITDKDIFIELSAWILAASTKTELPAISI